ncbi:hypothetical protein F0562_016045 [Nyssa sinensis]|uniref:Uncharacterized protein n=1 Tax=Nyssa sinensis TaxID=561372 RepID=A0A5J4ZNC8_9ASTE|nr:hypothetical protein F0562_016045 [Nyssa sinensis]
MPQVDLATLVSVRGGGGSGRKIACEPMADGDQPIETQELPDVPPDFPPESFWLSKDAEFDWFDRNAVFERKESTKGNSNSTNLNPNLNSSSQRFASNLKSKASIIGLPKTQKTSYVDAKRKNCKPPNIRLFPKRPESVGKSTVPVTEPSSPKVSCMGRVRSKRGRRRGFMAIFRSGRREKPTVERKEPPAESPPRKSVTVRAREFPAGAEQSAEAAGLGGMMRFASGRRSASWSADDLDQKSYLDGGKFERSDRD